MSTVIRHGLGQLTRPFGTAPVDPVLGARSLAASQAQIVAASRFGIPAQVHEECLTGFAAWRATVYPAPLCWGASFDPDLVEEMAGRIGRSMRAAGVHQGLAPVLDVTRDYRWGRTEETIGEDPYLVGTIGAAYVRGLERAGIVATLKHFAGYSASRGGRNLAPVPMGRRELADVVLPPFEMALRLGGARSVMNSYADIDGVPAAADDGLLTDLLREEWGFTGTVVADYFGVRFLQTLHGVAADAGDAAGLALRAGIDVELPTVDTFGAPLIEAVRSGAVDEALIDRALLRVLTQKAELGLLDADWQPTPEGAELLRLDDEESQEVALRLARQSVILLRNTGGVLPLTGHRASPWSARSRTIPWRCSAATPSPPMSGSAIPNARWVWTSPRCAAPSPRSVRTSPTPRAARSPARTPPGSPRPSPRRGTATCACSRSATGPACSGGAPPARAATSLTCACPACRPTWYGRCSPPVPRWFWSC